MRLSALGDLCALCGRALMLACMIACVMTSCATRKPGREYRWVPVYEATSLDGLTQINMGVGYKL